MEVIVRNLPDQITEKQVDAYFRKVLNKLGIKTFQTQKLRSRGCATITILDLGRARQFMMVHGQTQPGAKGFASVQQKLFHMNRSLNCTQSNKIPDEYLLKALKKEESDRYARQIRKATIVPGKLENSNPAKLTETQRAFDVIDLDCGQWTYARTDLAFASYSHEARLGRIVFGDRGLLLKLWPAAQEMTLQQVEIPYKSIHSFTLGPKSMPSLTFSLSEAPKFYESLDTNMASPNGNDLTNMLQNMSLRRSSQNYTRKRISALSKMHETVVASCLCYRVTLTQPNDLRGVQALKSFPAIPDSISWTTSTITKQSFAAQMTSLNSFLAGAKYSNLPFEIKFQIQRLAQNGILSPSRTSKILTVVARQLTLRSNVKIVARSIRSLCEQLPFAGPDTEASDLSLSTISEMLSQNQEFIEREESYSKGLAEQHEHIADVHKAMVTPTGIYLHGPEPEVKNRVLRKYSAYPNHFLSVSFMDEEGESLRFDRQTSGEEIYHDRFKKVLEGVINIAGRGYEFLGFSHSSLRSQTCWFMAPFTINGSLVYARSVIRDLGDFSLIRSPAKCAARIGQAFSQTFSSVAIPPEAFRIMQDVERNGRTFSDGVGTCSLDILHQIWGVYSQARGLKPTALQIRFQGAKGMISLDTRLPGSSLCLRPSMIKFGGTNAADIEICGSAMRPLPLILNRQLIKILEDLHVPAESFVKLQADAVEKLRMTTLSPINAASFLRRNYIGISATLPWLIRKLAAIGFSFSDDDFLSKTLELAVLVQLREIKHRSRIRVEKGVTVYGIMDETGLLQESEIYCFVQSEEGGQLITGNVVITRSPALHPGDVQCVTAVDVPADSPLRALHNVVVFSSKGSRDLPSQLSGGDLDGDLYNIIYDINLYPKRLAHPADYLTSNPIDIGRTVERSDMTDFFIKFMENDNLGLIATLHQILADQYDIGTFHPECVHLAELHSTAVDFSKTGIPVDFKQLPKYPKFRPDFQAPGPRVLIEKEINFEDEEEPSTSDGNKELDEVASYGQQKVRYYESQKVLGKLYREIDEFEILKAIQEHSLPAIPGRNAARSLSDAVWNYVNERTALIIWEHHNDFARDVKEGYEDNLVHTMLEYSTHPPHFLSEIEVFSGSILGVNGAQSKRQREFSKPMKEKYDRDVEYTVRCITRGDDNDSGEEALERSIACLYVACNETKVRKRVGALTSFVWIAAAVCLKEVEKLARGEILL